MNSLSVLVLPFFVSNLFVLPKLDSLEVRSQSTLTSGDRAVSLLTTKIKKDGIYNWTKLGCLHFNASEDGQFYLIEIREKHGNGCPGDPGVIPIVDRFRVNRQDGNVLWYNLLSQSLKTEDFLPYEKFAVCKQRQNRSNLSYEKFLQCIGT
jgi:hypothetical protein